MPGAVNMSHMPGGVTLALMLGVSRGIREVGGVEEGGGRVLGEAIKEGEGRALGEWGE
jgi:hypothetical protein